MFTNVIDGKIKLKKIKENFVLSADDIILKNHEVYGRKILPGLAYVDILYQFFMDWKFDLASVELRHVSIFQPLDVSVNKAADLEINCEQNDTHWVVEIHASNSSQKYITAELHEIDPLFFDEKTDIFEIKNNCEKSSSLEDLYRKHSANGLIHSGIMKVNGHVYSHKDYDFVELELSPEFFDDASQFVFHPALLDASSIGCGDIFSDLLEENNRLFLPLYYESFKAWEPIQAQCYTLITRQSASRRKDLISIDFEFFNARGDKVGEMKNFVNKMVRDVDSFENIFSPAPSDNKTKALISDQKNDKSDKELSHAFSKGAQSYLRQMFAEKINVDVEKIDMDAGYYELGMSSSMLLDMITEIEQLLSTSLSPILLFEYTSINELSVWLDAHYEHIFTESRNDSSLESLTQHKRFQKEDVTSVKYNPASGSANNSKDIAVIGIAGKYPKAKNIAEFWQNLLDGRDCISEIPASRWPHKMMQDIRSPSGKKISKWGGFVDNPEYFDAQFFRISPREAEYSDPQERLFLEVCWEAIEDAGYTPANLVAPRGKSNRRDVGVFAGVMHKDYTLLGMEAIQRGAKLPLSLSCAPIANRVSFFCNFHGPSMAIDTVCSSSLVAIHQAIESVRRDECKVAIAGGVNLSLHPNKYLNYGLAEMHSSDGYCHAFGEGGDGYVSADGIGAVVLKPLMDAMSDRDHIYAVIKGGSTNHVGKVNGFTVPSPVAQTDLICKSFDDAGVDPETITYVEAHGTGTPLGDPIEVQGLKEAFTGSTNKKQYCALGSVKSNIGHAESAAGISGLTKLILQLYYKTLVPTLHAERVNNHIDLKNSPFFLQTAREPWINLKNENGTPIPLRGSLSSFGATGTNTHLILEEYINTSNDVYIPQANLFPLSARSEERLHAYVSSLLGFLRENENIDLQSVAFTLQTGREAFSSRLVVLAENSNQLISGFDAWLTGEKGGNFWFGAVDKFGINNKKDHDKSIDYSLEEIAYAWVQGEDILWQNIYRGSLPKRISLPTYPFVRESHWINIENQQDGTSTPINLFLDKPLTINSDINNNIPSVNHEQLSIGYFVEDWEETELSTYRHQPVLAERERVNFVCFLSTNERQQALIDSLAYLKIDNLIFVAVTGSVNSQLSHFSIDPLVSSDYESVLSNIVKQYGEISCIYYGWAIEQKSWLEDLIPQFNIFRALKSVSIRPGSVLLGGEFSSGLEFIHLNSWIGFERSLGVATTSLRVNIVINENEGDVRHWAVTTARELALRIGFQAQDYQFNCLYRKQKKYRLNVKSLPDPTDGDEFAFESGAVYWISGGLGGLGRLFAEYFVEKGVKKLVLSGRAELNESGRAFIAVLENRGVEVFYMQCDIADPISMRISIQHVKNNMGTIRGVVNAAGISDNQDIFTKDFENFKAVISTKIQGTLLIDELLCNEPLDFFCLFSSVAAIVGDFGACDYSVANRFQYGFAQYRNELVKNGQRKGKTISICWPLWRDGGMNVGDHQKTEFYLKSSGQRFLDSEEGISVFEQILRSDITQVIIFAGKQEKLNAMLEKKVSGINVSSELKLSSSAATAVTTDTSLKGGASWRANGTELEVLKEELKTVASKTLKLEASRIYDDASFTDFGFDSVTLMEFANNLSQRFDIEVTPANFFNYSTINKLADYLKESFSSELACFRLPEPSSISIEDGQRGESGAFVFSSLNQTNENPAPSLSHAESSSYAPDSIAIIGMSGRFPNARNIDEFWDILSEEQSAIVEIPESRFDWRLHFGDSIIDSRKTNGKWCGILPGVGEFDSLFFEISPVEAKAMDPRQRLLLQESWRALENAAIGASDLTRFSLGMFVGVEDGDYSLSAEQDLDLENSVTSNHNAILASRLAYFLNLSGPVMAINTACSSGLVALHEAVLNIRASECDIAIVASANILSGPDIYVNLTQAGMLSPEGQCFAFDRRANGIVPGEAVVALVIKRLEMAKADGDPIHGVIRGSGINYDGKTNGITAPNGAAQEKLIKNIYNKYAINPENIEYVVAHGTGTRLGDPVEVNALTNVFRSYTDKQAFCSLASCKANVGHTFAASGLVSIVALLGAFQNEYIPAALNFDKENEFILWKNSPFRVNRKKIAWPKRDGNPRMGAVSAFGMSGTNAHVVIEEFIDRKPESGVAHPAFLIAISGKSINSLYQNVKNLLQYLKESKEPNTLLEEISYTLLSGRHHFNYRYAIIVSDKEDVIAQLDKVNFATFACSKVDRKFVPVDLVQQQLESKIKEISASVNNYSKGLNRIASWFCEGYSIDVKQLFGGRKVRKLSLPGYTFENDTFWFLRREKEVQSVPVSIEHASIQQVAISSPSNELDHLAHYKTVFYTPNWREEEIGLNVELHSYENHIVFTIGLEVTEHELQSYLGSARFHAINLNTNQPMQDYPNTVKVLINQVREIARSTLYEDALIQIVVPSEGDIQTFAGLSGMLKSASIETPNLIGQVIQVKPSVSVSELVHILQLNALKRDATNILYRADKRYVLDYERVHLSTQLIQPWKEKGVYLITGGMGGIGLIFAWEIARYLRGGTILLLGRTPINEGHLKTISELQMRGVKVEYAQVDVSNSEALQSYLVEVTTRLGKINGVLHSAGTIADEFLFKKTDQQIERVLAPKVDGVLNLVGKVEFIEDFLVVFSSTSAITGNIGQSDYAAANAFMDKYIKLKSSQESRIRFLSINWPLWQDGGMHMDNAVQQVLFEKHGIQAMSSAEGIEAFYRCMSSDAAHLSIESRDANIAPELGSDKKNLGAIHTSITEIASVSPSSGRTAVLCDSIVELMRSLLADVLGINIHKIDKDEEFGAYGIDSIIVTRMNRSLEKIYGSISKTLFFQFKTISELSAYLVKKYHQKSAEWAGVHLDDLPVQAATAGRLQAYADNASSSFEQSISNQLAMHKPERQEDKFPVAIIGVAGRYPQADNIDDFWRKISEGATCTSVIPSTRWSLDGFYEVSREAARANRKSYSKWGGFLENAYHFDADFFGILDDEAINLDPQERQFLEVCWHTLEDAAYTRDRLENLHQNRVGVFVGVTKIGYAFYASEMFLSGRREFPQTSFASIANRVSYHLNLQGPSIPFDTMCSSSLTAIHEACENLYRGTCELALAGGVNIYLHPNNYIALCDKNLLSSSNYCRSFGKGGDGFVPGEGVGALLLKPLDAAERDGDRIYGLIRSTGINHSGKTNGFHLSNPAMQAKLVEDTLIKGNLNPRLISYIEGHGTGTPLGDSIEISGLTQAFERSTQDREFCALGSAKANIGHLEAAAGIAGVTKILLQFKYKKIAPSIHCEEENDLINFDETPFFLNRKLADWNRPVLDGKEIPRIGAISAFGSGGTNAHIILEEYQAGIKTQGINFAGPCMVVISAKSMTQLKIYVRKLLNFVIAEAPVYDNFWLHSFAYTLQRGREAMYTRFAVLCSSIDEFKSCMVEFLHENRKPGMFLGEGVVLKSNAYDKADQKLLMDSWVDNKAYEKVLVHWVAGGGVDWDNVCKKLYNNQPPAIISLPLYPFASRCYWLAETNVTEKAKVQSYTEAYKLDSTIPIELSSSDEFSRYSKEELESYLIMLAGKYVGSSSKQIKSYDNYFDLGLNSMALVGMGREIQKQVHRAFKSSKFFELSTICGCAEYLFKLCESNKDGLIALHSSNEMKNSFIPPRGKTEMATDSIESKQRPETDVLLLLNEIKAGEINIEAAINLIS